jgi:hypothetical protein
MLEENKQQRIIKRLAKKDIANYRKANEVAAATSENDNKVTVSIRLPFKDVERFKVLADLEHRSLNSKITSILMDFITEWHGAMPDDRFPEPQREDGGDDRRT